ncbi:OsmC family protein [Brevibacterium senegalense]|uniref:OsmC family protein n=1 Tax=Brevibacterium senegalense TaxID=1033736 RepID=UPI0002FE913E|nr:OsmC family protein [Brevibacterium senegalense]
MTRDTTTRATEDDRVLYTATAHNRTGPDGESRTDGGLRVAVRSPLAPRPTAEAAQTSAATAATGAGEVTGTPASGTSAATDPEELLALAWATCLSGSARIVAPGRDVTVRVEVDLVEDPTGPGFAFEPTVFVSFSGTTPEQAETLAQQAHGRCPVSKLLTGRGHAAIVAEPWEDD